MTRATVTSTAADSPPVAAHVPPHAVIWDLATSVAISRCLHAVAGLGVADVLEPDGADIEELAAAVGVSTRSAVTILNQLEATGYLVRERRGRRNHYVLHRDLPLRHPSNAAHTVDELMRDTGELRNGEPVTAVGGPFGELVQQHEVAFPFLRAHMVQRQR